MDESAFEAITTLKLPEGNPAFEGARRIARILERGGFDAWLAGGSVRDMVMGIEPHDFDIATSARPEQVIDLFDRTIPVGVQFGVVIVKMSGFDYEVATFRADCGYSDGRRPDDVRFTDLREDVLRRDFTMNGIVCDPLTGQVVDLVGGLEDIKNRIIRAIGSPDDRFAEDRLRPMRAVRFAAQTGFSVEPATLAAIGRAAPCIDVVSAERIAGEYQKLLESGDPATGLSLAMETGLLSRTVPELETGRGQRAAELTNAMRGSRIELMWAAMLETLGQEDAAVVLRRLKRSNAMIEAVRAILSAAADAVRLPGADTAFSKRLVRRPFFKEGLALLDAVTKLDDLDTEPVRTGRFLLDKWTSEDLFPLPLIDGNDVVAAGVRGPAIADMLTRIEDAQLRGEIETREQALSLLAATRPSG